eukprot:88434_1
MVTSLDRCIIVSMCYCIFLNSQTQRFKEQLVFKYFSMKLHRQTTEQIPKTLFDYFIKLDNRCKEIINDWNSHNVSIQLKRKNKYYRTHLTPDRSEIFRSKRHKDRNDKKNKNKKQNNNKKTNTKANNKNKKKNNTKKKNNKISNRQMVLDNFFVSNKKTNTKANNKNKKKNNTKKKNNKISNKQMVLDHFFAKNNNKKT